MKASLIQSNALKIPLADNKVHCVVTSPPYYSLRKYTGEQEFIFGGDKDCMHEWEEYFEKPKGGRNVSYTPLGTNAEQQSMENPQMDDVYSSFCSNCNAWRGAYGLEPTLQMYVDHTVEWCREVWRVLRDDGTFWLNLGDSFAGSGKGGNQDRFKHNHSKAIKSGELYGFKPKDLMLVPHRVAIALQNDGWWVRSDIVWHKPNPMPESVKDRPTKSHEYIFLLTKSRKYYYDQEAIKEDSVDPESYSGRRSRGPKQIFIKDGYAPGMYPQTLDKGNSPDGKTYPKRNKRSVWTMTTKPYKGAHFATFPPELPETCIRVGTSEKGVCPICGAPWKRETKVWYEPQGGVGYRTKTPKVRGREAGHDAGSISPQEMKYGTAYRKSETIGWKPTCSHNEKPIPATVCDPFGGSGTTAAVAKSLGRTGICLDLSWEYLQLAKKRCGKVEYQYSFNETLTR